MRTLGIFQTMLFAQWIEVTSGARKGGRGTLPTVWTCTANATIGNFLFNMTISLRKPFMANGFQNVYWSAA